MIEKVTRKDILKRIEECEKNKEFDKHIDPIDYDNYYPVDENFHYIKKGFKEIAYNFILHNFIVKPFTIKINKKYQTVFLGRENLKGIKGAIITCNHVNKFDCLVVKKGVKGHNLFITAAYFNNQKGKFGNYMRAGGMMPFSNDHKAMKNFNEAIEKRVKSNYILFYPEQAMWWNYEKPRPYKNGAFHYAVKFKVPVIPSFITFNDTNKKDNEGIPEKKFYLHILKPIYPKVELNDKDNIDYLKEEAFNECREVYEKFYGNKLTYIEKDNI